MWTSQLRTRPLPRRVLAVSRAVASSSPAAIVCRPAVCSREMARHVARSSATVARAALEMVSHLVEPSPRSRVREKVASSSALAFNARRGPKTSAPATVKARVVVSMAAPRGPYRRVVLRVDSLSVPIPPAATPSAAPSPVRVASARLAVALSWRPKRTVSPHKGRTLETTRRALQVPAAALRRRRVASRRAGARSCRRRTASRSAARLALHRPALLHHVVRSAPVAVREPART